MTNEPKKVGRREFMSTAAVGGLMIIKPQLVRGTAANSSLRVGLLGCGERGTHVATALAEHPRRAMWRSATFSLTNWKGANSTLTRSRRKKGTPGSILS